MKLQISGYDMELFETESDYIRFLNDQPQWRTQAKYHGKLYGIPHTLKVDIVEMKKKCYNNIEFLVIY